MTLESHQHLDLWPTPVGLHRFDAADAVNPTLARAFLALRATAGAAGASFHASDDDLLQRIRIPEWDQLIHFIVDALHRTVAASNRTHWPESAPGLRIALRGIWFQIANGGAHHDVHTHGNCSWSGVYCVQADDASSRCADPVYGHANGVTRFYGPYFNHLGGAFNDFGNVYLQHPHADFEPLPGRLIVFPSWLGHQAMPYRGESDRIIVSFNASVHAEQGSDQQHAFAAT